MSWFKPILATLLVSSTACSADFDSQMLLKDYRVVGIETTPPELAPNETVTLTVVDFIDDGDAPDYAWSVCLHSLGSAADYECTTEPVALDDNSPTLTLDLSADGFDLESRLEELGEVIESDGQPRSLERGFDIWLALESGPSCRGCTIRTVKRLTIRNGSDERNENPVIEALDVAGTPHPGGTVRLQIETDNPQRYTDPVTGITRTEQYLYSWYTSAGSTSPTRSFGEDTESELTLPTDSNAPLELIVTVRDGRGGIAVERTTVAPE